MNRRRLGSTLLAFFAVSALRTDRRTRIDELDFASCITDRESASAVGAAYLRLFPEHASRAALLSFLQLPDEPLIAAQISVAIEQRIQSDFEQQRTLVLERWLLARTEAALCGLVALE